MKRLLCALLALLLCLGMLAACEGQPKPAPTPEPTVAPTPNPEPTAAPTPEPEATPFIPSSDIIPTDPEVETQLIRDPASFEAVFSQNPIDKQYDQDYSQAVSFSMIRMACDSAAKRWKTMVETTYQADLELITDTGENATLREEQAEWEEICENRIQIIRDEADDSNEVLLSAARAIVLVYRDRAKELCQIYFDATGALPEFPAEEAAG